MGGRRRRRGRACASRRSTRAPTDAPEPQRFGVGELGRVLELACAPGRPPGRAGPHDGRLLRARRRAARDPRAGPRRRRRGLRPGVLAGRAWLAWSRPGRGRASRRHPDGPARPDERRRSRSPSRGSSTPSRCSPPTASYLAFLSRRSFDPIYDAALVRPVLPGRRGGRSWCRWPRAPRRRSAASPDGRPVAADEDDDEDRDDREPATETASASRRRRDARPVPSRDDDDRGRRRRPRSWSTSTGSPTGWCRSRSRRPATAGCAAAKDCLLWLPPPGQPACSATAARAPTRSRERPVLERYDLVEPQARRDRRPGRATTR